MALGMTVSELLNRISSAELSEWIAYYQIEPFGAERDNLHAGIVAAAQYNTHIDPKKSKALKPSDFLFEFAEKETEQKSPSDIYQTIRLIALASGAQIQ